MVPINTQQWEWLEARSPTLFLVGGGLVVVYAGLHGMEAATNMVLEPNPFEFGYVIGFLGLLGLYPKMVNRSPRLARAGAVAAVLGMIGLSAFTALHLAVLAGIVARGGPTWFAIFIPLPLIGFVVGYLSIGIASLRTDAHPQLVGLLLLAPGVIVVVMLIQMLAGWTSEFQAFVISAGEAMAHLAIGATIKTDSDPNHRNHSSHGDREVAAHD